MTVFLNFIIVGKMTKKSQQPKETLDAIKLGYMAVRNSLKKTPDLKPFGDEILLFAAKNAPIESVFPLLTLFIENGAKPTKKLSIKAMFDWMKQRHSHSIGELMAFMMNKGLPVAPAYWPEAVPYIFKTSPPCVIEKFLDMAFENPVEGHPFIVSLMVGFEKDSTLPDWMDRILAFPADPNALNKNQQSPLQFAVFLDSGEYTKTLSFYQTKWGIIEKLLDKGALDNHVFPHLHGTLFEYLQRTSQSEHISIKNRGAADFLIVQWTNYQRKKLNQKIPTPKHCEQTPKHRL